MLRENGNSPLLLICEHASNYIPPEYDRLGLSEEVLSEHIAYDPGALSLATKLSDDLDAALIYSEVSRLLFDCNRPPDAVDAMPARSERYDIPGNRSISEFERADRVTRFYKPFENRIKEAIVARPHIEAIATIHSFTPVYNGVRRDVELGVLHDSDQRFADCLLTELQAHEKRAGAQDLLASLNIQRNQPYGPTDGVTHTLQLHGIRNNLLNVMLEFSNEILADDSRLQALVEPLSNCLMNALKACCSEAQPMDSIQ